MKSRQRQAKIRACRKDRVAASGAKWWYEFGDGDNEHGRKKRTGVT
jgi:hypothetical protein